MPLEVRVDRSACQGSRSCERRAPATFSLDAERKSVPRSPPRDPEPVLREVAATCPFFAIEVVDSSPGEIER